MDENEQVREIYTQFGLAAFQAQCLEIELANLLSLMGLVEVPPNSQDAVKKIFSEYESKTLGRLMRKALERVEYSEEIQLKLELALKRRNELIHGYFASRIQRFANFKGREAIIKELIEFQNIFSAADKYVEIATTLFRKHLGITDEVIFSELEKVYGEEKARQIANDT